MSLRPKKLKQAGIYCFAAVSMISSQLSAAPFVEILSPEKLETTSSLKAVHVLGKVNPSDVKEVTVNGQEVPVYNTGLFVKDNIILVPGQNTISISAKDNNGEVTSRSLRVAYVENHESASSSDENTSIKTLPQVELASLDGESLEVGIDGISGMSVEVLWNGKWLKVPETKDSSGNYRRAVSLGSNHIDGPVTYRIKHSNGEMSYHESESKVSRWVVGDSPVMLQVKEGEIANINYSLTGVRLGGPYITELPGGTKLKAVGKVGSNYRVELASDFFGYVNESSVEKCPEGTPEPYLLFNSITTSTTLSGDEKISFAYSSPIPYVIKEIPAYDGKCGTAALELELFGADSAATWLIDRGEGTVIESVSINQSHSKRLKVLIELKNRQLWGYSTKIENGIFSLTVRKTPKVSPDNPFKGISVAIEAGHGGPNNLGARGHAGINEKTVNLETALLLQKKLEAAGAKVLQLRPDDRELTMAERSRTPIEANADIFVSIHANSSGTSRGFLSVGGASVYYKHNFGRTLADNILKEILKKTQLPNFGLVGNFNYSPIRVNTWMPAVLVEMAFMSNPEEEALLNDPSFRDKMATGIFDGLKGWLLSQKEM